MAFGLLVAASGLPGASNAYGATTVAPSEAGNVVRDDAVTITVSEGAFNFTRSLATSNFTRQSPLGLTSSCKGDNPAGTNNSPRSLLTVTGPGSVGVILSGTSPARDTSIAGALASPSYPVLNPQPAPGNSNYRGDVPPTSSVPSRGWSAPLSLVGRPAGTYTITTTTQNMVKTGSAACTIGTPVSNGSGGFTNAAPTLGPVVETSTFVYRPWQHSFVDVFGGGSVKMNVVPAELRQTVSGQSGAIISGGQSYFALPAGSFVSLPPDPSTCVADPAGCVPVVATECIPSAGCVPRIVIVNYEDTTQKILGFFDLETKAFISVSTVGTTTRVMASLGTAQDALYRDLLSQLGAAAAEQGIDLARLLATTVRVSDGTNLLRLSLLNGLQLSTAAGPAGVQIESDATVQAGIILNIYAKLGGTCTATAGDSDPSSAAPDRYTHSGDAGYTVQRSDYLPEVPRVGPLGALVGGPVYHITGDFVGAGSTIVNTGAAVIGLDSAAGEPNGYPVWVQPFVSSPMHVTSARTMDFLGTATWSASETPIPILGCLTVDFLLGAGVALYNNPLPVGFGSIGLWDPAAPEVAALIAQINSAVAGAVNQVASDPTVASTLEQVVALLPV